MPTLGNALNFSKYEALNLRAHYTNPAPSAPVAGQIYYDSGNNTLFWFDGSVWVTARGGTAPDATTVSKGIVQLAGDLAGTAASPQIAAGVITDADVNSANKDGAQATASMRTLGLTMLQAMPGNTRLDQVGAPTGPLSLNNQRIVGLADPLGSSDAVTKNYVDGLVMRSVRVASTINLPLTGTPTIDGVALTAGDRVLVKNQTAGAANGVYAVAAGAWSRTPDADGWTDLVAAVVAVEQGTTQGDTLWLCTSNQGGTLGTTTVDWRVLPSDIAINTPGSVGQVMPAYAALDQIATNNPAQGNVSLNNRGLTNVLHPPTGDQDAATKLYVDQMTQGLDAHSSVLAATTANIAALIGGTPNTLDGVTLTSNCRVLVKNQTTPSQNGIYKVTSLGTGANGNWTRDQDADAWFELVSAYVWVEQGTTQADTGWICTADQGGTLETTAVPWVQFAAAGAAIAGAGLTKTGNTFDVGAGAGISVAADAVAVATNGITNAMLADGAVALNTADVTGTLPVANGGTGAFNAPNARVGLGAAGIYRATGPPAPGTTWSIGAGTHGLSGTCMVQVAVAATSAVEFPDITAYSNGDVVITWGASVTANSRVVVVIGG